MFLMKISDFAWWDKISSEHSLKMDWWLFEKD